MPWVCIYFKVTLPFLFRWCFGPWETLGHHIKLGENNWLRGGSNPQAMGGGWLGNWAGNSNPALCSLFWCQAQLAEGTFRFSKTTGHAPWGKNYWSSREGSSKQCLGQCLSELVHSALNTPSTAIWNIIYGCIETGSKIYIYCSM